MQVHVVWQVERRQTKAECSLTRGCAGVDLQVTAGGRTTTHERYPDSSTAYERARGLLEQYLADGYTRIVRQPERLHN